MARNLSKTIKKSGPGVSVAELSREFNLDRNTVKKRLQSLQPISFNARGGAIYDREDAGELLLGASEENAETVELKNAKLREEVEKLRLGNEEKAGRLMDLGEVRAALYEVIKLEYQRFTELPRRIAPKLASTKDVKKIGEILGQEIQAIFDEVGQHEFWGEGEATE